MVAIAETAGFAPYRSIIDGVSSASPLKLALSVVGENERPTTSSSRSPVAVVSRTWSPTCFPSASSSFGPMAISESRAGARPSRTTGSSAPLTGSTPYPSTVRPSMMTSPLWAAATAARFGSPAISANTGFRFVFGSSIDRSNRMP